jgi:hypothetical protein
MWQVLKTLIAWVPRMGKHASHHVEDKDQGRRDPLHDGKAFLPVHLLGMHTHSLS